MIIILIWMHLHCHKQIPYPANPPLEITIIVLGGLVSELWSWKPSWRPSWISGCLRYFQDDSFFICKMLLVHSLPLVTYTFWYTEHIVFCLHICKSKHNFHCIMHQIQKHAICCVVNLWLNHGIHHITKKPLCIPIKTHT